MILNLVIQSCLSCPCSVVFFYVEYGVTSVPMPLDYYRALSALSIGGPGLIIHFTGFDSVTQPLGDVPHPLAMPLFAGLVERLVANNSGQFLV